MVHFYRSSATILTRNTLPTGLVVFFPAQPTTHHITATPSSPLLPPSFLLLLLPQILQEVIAQLQNGMRTTADMVSGISELTSSHENPLAINVWICSPSSPAVPPSCARCVQYLSQCVEVGPWQALLCTEGSAAVQGGERSCIVPVCVSHGVCSPLASL